MPSHHCCDCWRWRSRSASPPSWCSRSWCSGGSLSLSCILASSSGFSPLGLWNPCCRLVIADLLIGTRSCQGCKTSLGAKGTARCSRCSRMVVVRRMRRNCLNFLNSLRACGMGCPHSRPQSLCARRRRLPVQQHEFAVHFDGVMRQGFLQRHPQYPLFPEIRDAGCPGCSQRWVVDQRLKACLGEMEPLRSAPAFQDLEESRFNRVVQAHSSGWMNKVIGPVISAEEMVAQFPTL